MPRATNTYGGDGNIVIGTSVDMYGMNTGLKKIEKSFKRLNYMLGGIIGITGLAKLGKAALDAASNLEEVQNIVDVTFGDMSEEVDTFAKTAIDKFGISELAAKQTAGSFMAMGKALNISQKDAKNMSLQLTALTGDMSSFYNISQDYARTALSAVYTGETETLKRYGIVLTEANLQEYALSQGIDTQVKKMDARSKAMLRYKYIVDQLNFVSGDFERTQNSWANQVRLLSQSWTQFLNVLGKGLTTVLTPMLGVLRRIVVALTALAKTIGGTFVKVFGIEMPEATDTIANTANVAEDAAEAEDELADATENASKAAKKSLAVWDDLNVLQQDTSNLVSGKNNKGNVGDDLSSIDFGIEDYAVDGNALEEFIHSFDSLFDLGRYISDGLATAMAKIDWEPIYNKARGFGRGLADFLNGLITPDLFYQTGRTIAGALNTAIYASLSFARTFDFKNLGLSIANGINGLFRNFDAGAFADSIDAWVQGIFDVVVTALANIDWLTVWDKAKEFLENIDLKTVAIIIGAITIKKIGGFIFFGGLASLLSKALLSPVTSAFSTAFGEALSSSAVMTAITDKAGAIGGALANALPTIGGIVSIIGGMFSAVLAFIDMLKNGFSWFDEIIMVLGVALTAIGAIILGAPAVVAGAVAGIVAALATIVVVVKDNWAIISAFFKRVFDKIELFLHDIIDSVVSNVTTIMQSISEILSTIRSIIHKALSTIDNFIYGTITNITNGVTLNVSGIKDFLSNILNSIKTITSNVLSRISGTIGAVINGISNAIIAVLDTIKAVWNIVFNSIKTTTTVTFNGIWNFIKKIINTIISGIERFANSIISAINAIINAFNILHFDVDMPDWIAKKTGVENFSFGLNIPNVRQISIPRLAKGGVIPANAPFMAMLGDQKHGTNIEAPLDTIVQAMIQALGQYNNNRQNQQIVLNIDGQTLARLIVPYNLDELNRRGYNVNVLSK
jgi:phage-related protein